MADDLSKLSDSELLALRDSRGPRVQPPVDASKLSDAELSAAARAKSPTFTDRLSGLYQSLDVGAMKGVAGLAALPHTMSEMGQRWQEKYREEAAKEFGPAPNPPPTEQPAAMQWPSYEEMQNRIKASPAYKDGGWFGADPNYKPKNAFEEGAQTFGEFSVGALAPGGPLARFARVAAPTVGSEFLGQLSKGEPAEPYLRMAGGVIGGGAQGGAEALISRPSTAREILAKQMPEGITPQHITNAEEVMQIARTLPGGAVPLTWPEAISLAAQRPVFSDLMRHLEASSKSGPRMAEFYADRPQRVAGAVEGQAERLSPGPPTDPSALGPQVQDAANSVLTQERQAISARSDPYYAAAAIQRVSPQEYAYAQSLPGWNAAAQDVRANPQFARSVAGLPEDSVGFFNAVKKRLQERGEHATSPMRSTGAPSAEEASGWISDADVVRQSAVNASQRATPPGGVAPYPEALRIETEMRAQRLQPLLEGPLGKIVEAKPEIKSAVDVLFPQKPTEIHGEAAVGDAVNRIAQVSPKVARDVVRAHLEMMFDVAGRNLQTGPNQASGGRLNVLLGGSGQQRRNLQAAVEALPNGAQTWDGYRRFLDVMEATGTRQNIGSRTAYNAEALREFNPSGVATDVAKVVADPMRGAKPFIEKFNEWKQGRNLNEAAAILTDPNSGNLLRQIAASPRGGAREANVIRALMFTQMQRQSLERPVETAQ